MVLNIRLQKFRDLENWGFLNIRLQKFRDLENWVRGPTRSLEISP